MDNNATTAVAPEVVDAMLPYWEQSFGNPSSVHKKGIEAERAVKNSRKILAEILNVKDTEIYFTSGATEADNCALKGAARALKRRGNHIITSKVEHEAVLETCKILEKEGFHMTFLDVDTYGRLDENQIVLSVTDKTILTSFMHVNNELGTIYPINSFVKAIKKRKPDVVFFSDGAQAFGKIAIDLSNIDLYALSAHKMHGPKGIGALIKKEGIRVEPLLAGGGQENGMRSGTENVPGIIGFAKAASLAYENFFEQQKYIESLRGVFVENIVKNVSNININSPDDSIPSTVNIAFLGIPAEVLMRALDAKGVYVSAGSACSTAKQKQSHVLTALGKNKAIIESSIRFSFSRYLTNKDILYAAEVVVKTVVELRSVVAQKTLRRQG